MTSYPSALGDQADAAAITVVLYFGDVVTVAMLADDSYHRAKVGKQALSHHGLEPKDHSLSLFHTLAMEVRARLESTILVRC